MSEPGKYDDLCTEACKQADAIGCILIIFGGKKGAGFSAQLPAFMAAEVPGILRDVAGQIERDMQRLNTPHG
jgi:hypothetical protein